MSIARSNRIFKTAVPSRQYQVYLNLASLTGSPQARYAWNSPFYTLYSDLASGTTLPSGFSTGVLSPTNIGSRWVDYQEYFGHRRGLSNYEDGSRLGLIILREWGNGSTGLLWHTADAVLEAVDGEKGPFCANGISGWKSWTEQFVSGVLSNINNSGIFASGPALPYMAICGCTQRNNIQVQNWWPAIFDDPRYQTEIVARIDGTGFTVSGLYSRYIAAGGSGFNGSLSIDHPNNELFASWWFEMSEIIRDYAATEAFYKPVVSGLGVTLYGIIDTRLPAKSGNYYHDIDTSGVNYTNRYNYNTIGTLNVCNIQNSLSHGPHGTAQNNWIWTNNTNIVAVTSGSNKTSVGFINGRTGIIDGQNITLTPEWFATGMHILANANITHLIVADSIAFAASGSNTLYGSTGIILPTGLGGGGGES